LEEVEAWEKREEGGNVAFTSQNYLSGILPLILSKVND